MLMFSSNQVFRISGENTDDLRTALCAALSISQNDGHVRSYHLSAQNGLLFGWREESKEGWTVLPAPADVGYMTLVTEAYLKSVDAEAGYNKCFNTESFGDGDVEKGWEVFYPEEPYPGLNVAYAIVGIKPRLIHYAK